MGNKFKIFFCGHFVNVSNAYGHYKHTFVLLVGPEFDSWRVLRLPILWESVILSQVFASFKVTYYFLALTSVNTAL
jgi:hypothetical protein